LIVILRFNPAIQRHSTFCTESLITSSLLKLFSLPLSRTKIINRDRFCISCANAADDSLSSQNAVIGLFSVVPVDECEAGIISRDTMWYSGESERCEAARPFPLSRSIIPKLHL
jgi:hypothetical protein